MEYVPVAERTGSGTGGISYTPVDQRATSTPATAAPAAKPSFIDTVKGLFGGGSTSPTPTQAVQSSPVRPTYVPVSQRDKQAAAGPVAPSPAPQPSTLTKLGTALSQGWDKVAAGISKATSNPSLDELPKGGLDANANTLAYLPSEIVRHLPFGIGAVISTIQDDPETAARLGLQDVKEAAPGAVLDQVKEFAKMPVAGALDLAGSSAQAITGGKYNGQIHFNIPGLGDVGNAQFRAAQRVSAGEDPVQVALEEGASSIFETLFFLDIASRPFVGRPTKTAEFRVKPGQTVATDEGALPSGQSQEVVSEMPAGPKDLGPKSFRLYEKPVVNAPLSPAIIARMEQQGIDLGPRFNPDLPTYFRVSPASNGDIVGEVIQIKPSILSVITSKFNAKAGPFAEEPGAGNPKDVRQSIKHSEAFDVEDSIKNGDIAASQVYSDPATKTLTPTFAQGRITDIAQKLDNYKPGLGQEFRASVDPNNATLSGLEQAGMDVLDKHVAAEGRSTPLYRYEGGEKGALFQKFKDAGGTAASTVGDGKYFAYDDKSSSWFGDNLHQYQMPNDLNLYDATAGKPNDLTGMNGLDGDPLYRRSLAFSGGDMLKQAAREGYDGVIFFADDGTSKWVAIDKNVKLPEGTPPPVKNPPAPAITGATPKETTTLTVAQLAKANLPEGSVEVLHKQTVNPQEKATPVVQPPPQAPKVEYKPVEDRALEGASITPPETVQNDLETNGTAIIATTATGSVVAKLEEGSVKITTTGSPAPSFPEKTFPSVSAAVDFVKELAQRTPAAPAGGKTLAGIESQREGGIPESRFPAAPSDQKPLIDTKEPRRGEHIYSALAGPHRFGGTEHPARFIDIPGSPVDLGVPGEFFIHRPFRVEGEKVIPYDSGWDISEVRSGMKITSHATPTKKGAIEYAKTIMNAVPAGGLEKAVKQAHENYGKAPEPRKPKTQKEKVKEVVAKEPASIKEVAEKTGILEPNVRRILGVGAKDGTFERVDEGVYVLKKDGKEYAWIEAGDAVDVLPRLAKEGKKFDMVFLDPAYFSRALIGGNRGIKTYQFIHPPEFRKVMDAVSELVANDKTQVYLMLSGARTAQGDMEKYAQAAAAAGFKVIGEGKYTKLFANGQPVSNVRGEQAAPERIILFTQSGQIDSNELPNLDFRFVRPSIAKGYATEKPKELLHALITQSTLEGQTVLDPFAGSGVAGEQALASGRKAYLVEKNADVVEKITKPRVEAALPKEKAPAYQGGSAGANIGTFSDGTPIKAGGMDNISPVELPELVDIARELMGKPPEVRAKLGKKLGVHSAAEGLPGSSKITVRADLFSDLEQATKTLAHEIGHLIDFLPEGAHGRGNLLGRLFTLKKFLKSTFDKNAGAPVDLNGLHNQVRDEILAKHGVDAERYKTDVQYRTGLKLGAEIKAEYKARLNEAHIIKDPVIKQELQNVSDYWRPWDKEGSSASYRAYRGSSSELYADAISMLFNSPGLLEEMAPTFYKEFFDALDRKPEVKDAYFETQSLLNGDRELLVKKRREGVQGMFKEGDVLAADLQKQRIAEYKARNRDILQRLKHELVDKNTSIIKRVAELEKKGVVVNPDDNPIYYLEERNYLGGKIKYTAEDFSRIYKTTQQAGIPWDMVGERLFYERIEAGDRSEQANPRGITPAAATELLDHMAQELGGKKWDTLTDAIDDFRSVVRRISEEAFNEGLYSQELYDQMLENPKYATYQVLDHIDDQVSHKVFKSVGTFKDIANPADATILKTMATIRAIERNKVQRTTVDFLQQHFPDEVREADKRFSGKSMTYVESKNPKEELTFVYRGGKATGYYVDPYVAGSLRNESIGQNLAVLKGLRMANSGLFRPLFIAFNPGFQAFNFLRDFERFWKAIPDMTLWRAVQRYRQALPMAKVRAFGLPDNPTPKEMAAYRDLRYLENGQVFSFTFNDLLDGAPDDEKQIERILRQSNIPSFQQLKPELRQKILKPFLDVAELIKKTGDVIETLPKGAGFYEFTAKNGGRTLTREQRSYIRKYLGSPDFLAGGAIKPATNEIFLFSNAIVQGIRSDIFLATDPKTRSGYWWKTAKINIVPHLLMLAAALGFFGKEIKDLMDSASEYDKTNYIVVPLGRDAQTQRAIYLRFPQDETGRLVGGMVWKVLNATHNTQELGQDMSDIFSFTAGQLPSVSPAITAASAGFQYFSGQNPYDSFRGRNVISDDVFKAGGWRSLSSFLGWEFQELGGGTFISFYNEPTAPKNAGPAEAFLGLPVIKNFLGRFIRATDYGKTEELNAIAAKTQSEQAQQRLADNDIVNAALKKAIADPNIGANRGTYEAQLRDAIKGDGPFDATAQQRFDRARTRFRLGLIRGSADAETTALLNAGTNQEKADILTQIKSELDDAAYQQYIAELRRSGVITNDVLQKVNHP